VRQVIVRGAIGLLLLGAAAPPALAQGTSIITDPRGRAYRAAVRQFAAPAGAPADAMRAEIIDGLDFSSLFASIGPEAFLEPLTNPRLGEGPPLCSSWSQIGADALVEGELRAEGPDLVVEYRVLDVALGCSNKLHKRYRGGVRDVERLGKAIADDIVEAFTGTRGVAGTEIALISTRTRTKEVWVMDADGGNQRRATTHGSLNAFPSWNSEGSSIVYTSYRHQDRPGIFVLTRGGQSPGRILRNLNGGAPQYRAVFDPKGQRLALVMSVDGAAEIFTVGKNGQNLRRLTRSKAIDIGPAWSPDGSRIAFVSDQTGSPQIYVMDQDGGNQRRVTFQGGYNTSPSWSPDGRWIAYETRIGGQFDIWLTDPEGSVASPLVQHPRSDEHPTWAPDSRKLAFSSTRRGRADIYAVDIDGNNVRQLTSGAGENTTPAWGPYRR
jgi:TolB protein